MSNTQQMPIEQLINMKTMRFDPAVDVGTLKNGFKYFIAQNKLPENKVYIRLVVNAGSMNEDDDQRGVAHIVEHMAFNGTENFPGNKLIRDLEKAGLKFGIDVNAFTDFENTVYTLNLPDNNEKKINLALDVVSDWASRVTVDKDDLDAERGIVLEEWRSRLGAMLRLGDKKSAIEMKGSRYVLRDPIGDVDTIKNVSQQRVADFYHRWYRPDNMAIVVVGDIDKQTILSLLENKLGQQIAPTSDLEIADYSIPLVEHWRSESVHEDEILTPAVELSFFSPYIEDYSLTRYRNDLINNIVVRLINIRLQHFERQNDDLFSTANYYSSNIGRNTSQSIFSLQLADEKYDEATLSIFKFLAQIQQYGFSQSEFDEELERLKLLNEKNADKKTYSIDLASDIMQVAAANQLLIGQQDKFLLNQYYMQNISLADINEAFNQLIATKSKLVINTQTNKDYLPVMNAQELETNWNTIFSSPQIKWDTSAEQITQLPELNLQPGSIKLLKRIDDYNIIEYRLSNGSKLVYQYNDDHPNRVFFKAVTQGGLRSIPNDDYHRLRIATTLTDETGFGRYSLSSLQAIFNKSPVVMSTLIDDYQQGFSGWAEVNNFEKILTLFHLKLNESIVSNNVLNKYKSEMRKQFSDNNQDIFMHKISALRYPKQHTIYDVTAQDIDSLTIDNLTSAYNHYISKKTDFTYFIVGDIKQQDVERIAAKYLSSIKVHKPQRSIIKLEPHTPTQSLIVKGLQEPRAEVEIYLVRKTDWRPDNAYYLEIGGELVQEKLREKLREQASGVYGVTSWFWHNPVELQEEGRIMFTCDPNRVDELISLTQLVLSDFQKKGIDKQVLTNKLVQSKDILQRTQNSVSGMFEAIERSYMLTDGPLLVEADLRANKDATLQKVEKILQDFLLNADKFNAVLLPIENN